MNLVVISGATRPRPKSNTARIIEAFLQGFEASGGTAEVYYLSDKKDWDGARNAIANGTDILFAIPLYVENIPGSMLEFLETVTPKTEPGTRISFLLQGGFPEACQSRCCEAYLKTLPERLGCSYGGTLIRGNMFAVRLMGEKIGSKMVEPFIEVGRLFAQYGCFDERITAQFNSPEHMTQKEIDSFKGIRKYRQRWCMDLLARFWLGCKTKLSAKPYSEGEQRA